MELTYGIVADRLSDLVGDLTDLCNGSETEELVSVIISLDNVRAKCDRLSFEGVFPQVVGR